ncbi:hypothetical protein AB0I10_23140 [Streptomyces sp. NPDC050636]|uniref:hypothetical protein n=1 Tax=Streptomyces sp. NPDC050636 TaxID=3154510 RepID=UPI00343570C1
MSLPRDKEPASGLDFTNPAAPSETGRTSPTLLVLPRGHYFGGKSGMGYTFPALEKPGAVRELADEALARIGTETGVRAPLGRRILTTHSGGGASLMAILRHTDPDEVFVFDALYANPDPLIAWARRRIDRASGALRVLYRAREGAARNSEKVHNAVRSARSWFFSVERTTVGHSDIPRRYGWRLLADAAAELPDTSPVPGGPSSHEAVEELEYVPGGFDRYQQEAQDSLAEETFAHDLYGEDPVGEETAGERTAGEEMAAVDVWNPGESLLEAEELGEAAEVEAGEWELSTPTGEAAEPD